MILSGKVKDGEKVAISAGRQGITFNGEVGQGGGVAQSGATRRAHGGRLQPSSARSREPRPSHELRAIRFSSRASAFSLVGRLHWIVYWVAIFDVCDRCRVLTALGQRQSACDGVMIVLPPRSYSACCFSGSFVHAWFIRWITEIAVTDRRIIYKRGFIYRAHRGDEHGQGRLGRRRPVDPRANARLRHNPRFWNWRRSNHRWQQSGRGIEHLHRIASPLALRNAITAK